MNKKDFDEIRRDIFRVILFMDITEENKQRLDKKHLIDLLYEVIESVEKKGK